MDRYATLAPEIHTCEGRVLAARRLCSGSDAG
jgi:hypothetical protein